jgi:hypothetical protein
LPKEYPFEANIIKRATIFVNGYRRNFRNKQGMQGFLGLAVRGTGERDSDVGDILLAQPAQQGHSIIYQYCGMSKTGPGPFYPKRQDDGRLNNSDRQLGIKKKVSQECEINRNS